jgi:hypothetical protein
MLYAVAALRLHCESVNVDADVVLRDLLMVAFMTTIGMGVRLQLIRQGGARVIWFLGISSLGAADVPGGADCAGVSDRLHEFADHYGIGDLDEVKRAIDRGDAGNAAGARAAPCGAALARGFMSNLESAQK